MHEMNKYEFTTPLFNNNNNLMSNLIVLLSINLYRKLENNSLIVQYWSNKDELN